MIKNFKIYSENENFNCVVEAETRSKALYKAFKNFYYDEECYVEPINVQFKWFLNEKYKISKTNLEKTLTFEEEKKLKQDNCEILCNDFNEKYPIGTKVLFQGDGKNEAIITKTRSKAEVYSDYLIIFLENVSGSYLLDDKFVRVLNEDNKNLKYLR